MENKQLNDLAMEALALEQETQAEEARLIPIQELDQRLAQLRELRDKYDEAKKISDKLYKEFEEQKMVLYKLLESVGRDRYKVEGIGTLYTIERGTYKLDEARKHRLFEYIKKNYGDDALDAYLTINPTVLHKFVATEVGQGGLPPGVLPFESNKQITFRKG